MLMYESNEYRANKNWPYAICAGCLVYRKTDSGIEVLLLKRNAGHSHNSVDGVTYNLPKGHVDFGETLEQTALRETEEEAGCKVKIQTYLGANYREFNHPKFKVDNKKTIHFFAAEWVSDTQSMDNEHDDREWVYLDKATDLLGGPNFKGEEVIATRLKQFLELSGS
jgi:8-oxo-dGTP pyrophosphatase MutT (NUDIX family)